MMYLDFPKSLFSLSQTSSAILFGDRNPALSCTDIRDYWLRNDLLFHSWNKLLYYFSCFMAGLFTVQCVYLYISNSDEIRIPPRGVRQTGVSISQYALGKSWPHRAASNYLCLLGAWSYAHVVLFMFMQGTNLLNYCCVNLGFLLIYYLFNFGLF